MGFKEPYPDIPYATPDPPPANIIAIANKVLIKRIVEYTSDEQIAAGEDDSCKLQNGFSNTAAYLATGHWNSEDQHAAMRFTGITLPADAIITSAYIKFTAAFTRSSQSIKSNIYGEKTQAPVAYGATEDFTARDRTTAFVAWDDSLTWVAESVYNSPELKTIIQELVDAYGAYSDGVVALQWLDDGTSPVYSTEFAYAYDTDSAKAPILHIEYCTSADLTNKYEFQYRHYEEVYLGYLYVVLLKEANPEALFSINQFATPNIEFTRLTSAKLEVYYDDVLITTMPSAAVNTLYDGYYILEPIPA